LYILFSAFFLPVFGAASGVTVDEGTAFSSELVDRGDGYTEQGFDIRYEIPQMERLIRSCFDPIYIKIEGPPKNSHFTLRAIDDWRNVSLTFLVNGDAEGRKCTLTWDDWLYSLGKISSKLIETEDPVPRIPYIIESGSTRYEMAEITIDIYHKGNFPHWELTSLYPANLVSGSFVRSFISQAMLYHQQLLPGQEIKLLLNDNSDARELYWLEKQEGLTYYEAVWGLQYNCLALRLSPQMRVQFSIDASQAFHEPAFAPLTDLTWRPVRKAAPSDPSQPYFQWSEEFKSVIQQWIDSETDENLGSFSIGEALDYFIPFWSQEYGDDLAMYHELAQNTFVFFFRKHPYFDALARHVLTDYDKSCQLMTGFPTVRDPDPFKFVSKFNFHANMFMNREEERLRREEEERLKREREEPQTEGLEQLTLRESPDDPLDGRRVYRISS